MMPQETQAALTALERRLQVAKAEVAALTQRLATIDLMSRAAHQIPPSRPPTECELQLAAVIGGIKDVVNGRVTLTGDAAERAAEILERRGKGHRA